MLFLIVYKEFLFFFGSWPNLCYYITDTLNGSWARLTGER